jgi:SM-20-related protein
LHQRSGLLFQPTLEAAFLLQRAKKLRTWRYPRLNSREGTVTLQAHRITEPPMLNIDGLQETPLNTVPFEHVIVENFIHADWEDRLMADFPAMQNAGSFALSTLMFGSDFARLIEQMNGVDFRTAVEEKFSISLVNRPTIFTVRGVCRSSDGKIHTDSETKLITVLLYMNPRWGNEGGRLRLLRSATNIDDAVLEVPPTVGTLLIFKRSDHSYHGHLPFEGVRKVVQMNWVVDQKTAAREQKRHRWTAALKRLRLV